MSAPLRSVLLAGLVLGALAVPASAATAPATVWLCRPGLASNPCTPGQQTTRFTPAGKRIGVADTGPTRTPSIDCFYVYPTVSDQKTPIANRAIDPPERSIALWQAAN